MGHIQIFLKLDPLILKSLQLYIQNTHSINSTFQMYLFFLLFSITQDFFYKQNTKTQKYYFMPHFTYFKYMIFSYSVSPHNPPSPKNQPHMSLHHKESPQSVPQLPSNTPFLHRTIFEQVPRLARLHHRHPRFSFHPYAGKVP